MNKTTGVIFIIIRPSGEMLMQLRDGNSTRYPHMWCFPGGSVDEGEEPVFTVIREIDEEYELKIRPEHCQKLMEYTLSYGSNVVVFVCNVDADQRTVMHEGADMRWMRFDEIKKIELGFEQKQIHPKLEIFLNER